MNEVIGTAFSILAYPAGYAVYRMEAKRRQMDLGLMTEVALWGVIAGVVCAAIAQTLFSKEMWTMGTPVPGRTILGGVLGGWAGVVLAKRRLRISYSTGPLWALAIPAGEAVGRIGCFFHGCCHGVRCDLPWAVMQHGALRHPTQIYASIAAFTSLAILWNVRESRFLFPISLTLFAVSRLIIEPLRESTAGQGWIVYAVCSVILALAGVGFWRGSRNSDVKK